jgi:hypothetical protein
MPDKRQKRAARTSEEDIADYYDQTDTSGEIADAVRVDPQGKPRRSRKRSK